MRMMVTFSFPNEAGNKAVSDGSIGTVMERILGDMKPEAAYFATNDEGERGGFIIFEMKDASDMVKYAEPLFQQLNCRVRFKPVMVPDDLRKGMIALREGAAAGRG